jgi:hypothetical protein
MGEATDPEIVDSELLARRSGPESPESTGDDVAPDPRPGPWPWYALLGIGHAVCGLFPWLMVSWALYRREKKRAAALSVAANVVLAAFLGWVSIRARLPWWWLLSLAVAVNLLWSTSAWVAQRRLVGPAPRRYHLRDWRTWTGRVVIGAALGCCVGVVVSIPPALNDRAAMIGSVDSLDRQTVLWDCFQHVPAGLLAGLVVGLWWAGGGRRFRASHVVTFLSALVLTFVGWSLLGALLLLILQGGANPAMALPSTLGSLIPPWVSGFPSLLLRFEKLDVMALVAVPLLFGAPTRLRDFGRGALLVPLAFVVSFPTWFASTEMWSTLQPQILHDTRAGNAQTRASAYRWVETLLRRFPDHTRWPAIAEDLARHWYEQGEVGRARALYRELADRVSGSNEWRGVFERAEGALGTADFARRPAGPGLEIPMVDYEAYLTRNWMALLAVVRYWEGPEVPESEVKIRLKELSRSDDEILLSPLTSLAELDDAARNLGYESLILPADPASLKALLAAGFPVIHQDGTSFHVMFGFDPGRSAFRAYGFEGLSSRLRLESRKEARQILALQREGAGESRERLARVANEAYREDGASAWAAERLADRGPLMAVVCPDARCAAAAGALNVSLDDLRKRSRASLAALVGLAFLRHADPLQAVEWAKIGARIGPDPLPLHVGHLAATLWRSRDTRVRSRIPLAARFPELSRLSAVFDAPGNRDFLEAARRRFEADREAGRLASFVSDAYLSMLDRSDARDREVMIQVRRARVSADPSRFDDWKALADTCEWSGDVAGMTEALEGAVSARAEDPRARLRLAYGDVLLGRLGEARDALEKVDRDEVRGDADYPFCVGAVAEWEGDTATALREYERAARMRTYRPVFHLRYGSLLLREGRTREARRALRWAARIDAVGDVRREAERLLAGQETE